MARDSLRRASENLGVAVAFVQPASIEHLIENRQAGRVAMIRRSAHAGVVQRLSKIKIKANIELYQLFTLILRLIMHNEYKDYIAVI